MICKIIDEFDLEKIAASGQCFRMGRLENGRFFVKAARRYLELEQNDNHITFYCSEKQFQEVWKDYFDLDTDYRTIRQSIDPEDAYMQRAAEMAAGIRILKQDLWETLITFIISQQNNIPRIKKCVNTLCDRYGKEHHCRGGMCYRAFPTADRLARCSEQELREAGLGYRARYIQKTAQAVASGEINLEEIQNMPYEKAKETLLCCSGVGIKVAECICLYALHHIDAFPVDTHIQDMLTQHYPEGFPFDRYAGFAGILQQYGFFYELHGKA